MSLWWHLKFCVRKYFVGRYCSGTFGIGSGRAAIGCGSTRRRRRENLSRDDVTLDDSAAQSAFAQGKITHGLGPAPPVNGSLYDMPHES